VLWAQDLYCKDGAGVPAEICGQALNELELKCPGCGHTVEFERSDLVSFYGRSAFQCGLCGKKTQMHRDPSYSAMEPKPSPIPGLC